MRKNEEIASDVLYAVGGKENVTFVNHCMTRLRFILKDESSPKLEEIKKISGVLGAQFSGGQLQIVIGQNVDAVYDAVCKEGGFEKSDAINENLDSVVKKDFSIKGIFNSMMDALAGTLTPIIPLLIAAGLLKMLVAVLGPSMLKVLSDQSDLYRILNIAGDAGFYYLPVFIAWSGAKKFKCNPIIAMIIAVIMIHPSLLEIVTAGKPFTVYGIPMKLVNYSTSVIPMVLITWLISYVERFLNKYVPQVLKLMLVPVLTILIMLPISLCVIGPLGTFIGEGFSSIITILYNTTGPLGTAVIGALWLPIVAGGMHVPIIMTVLATYAQNGYDAMLFPLTTPLVFGSIATALVFIVKSKKVEDKNLGVSCLIAQALGGVGEPTIFGIMFRFKKLIAYDIIGGFVAGFYIGITHTLMYVFVGVSNVLAPLAYVGGTKANIINGIIACVINFAVTLALGLVFGYEDKSASKTK